MLFYLLILPVLQVFASPLEPRQSAVRITSVTASGSGCPPGSFSQLLSDDGTILGGVFKAFTTVIGPNSGTRSRELSCDVQLALEFSATCSSAVVTTTTRGHALLTSTNTGTLTRSFQITPGSSGSNPPVMSFSSADSSGGQDYVKQESISIKSSQKTASLKFSLKLFLDERNANEYGTLTVDSSDIKLGQVMAC
jgi:hypothetical protein